MNIEKALQKILGFGVKEFKEKAIEGGYDIPTREDCCMDYFYHSAILLDILAWQAVGKVEGWGFHPNGKLENYKSMVVIGSSGRFHWQECIGGIGKSYTKDDFHIPIWLYKMHRMIDALAEGKTIEEFIETL